MQSAAPRGHAMLRRGLFATGVCALALLGASAAAASADAPATQGRVVGAATVGGLAPAAAAKPCRKVKVKKRTKTGRVVRRHGKPVYVMRKKCKKPAPALPTPLPIPGPLPQPVPGEAPAPTPAPSAPRIDQVLGWSTVAADPDTPPADLVASGGTITSCPNTGGLSVYINRSGFVEEGLVSYVRRHDGKVVASGTNTSTADGGFRHGLNGSPLPNGVYEIVWTYGGATIGAASVTRAC